LLNEEEEKREAQFALALSKQTSHDLLGIHFGGNQIEAAPPGSV
jgi:hypothetical protein